MIFVSACPARPEGDALKVLYHFLSLYGLPIVSFVAALVPPTASSQEVGAHQSMVVPAPRPRHPALAATMNRQARVSLEELGYTSVSEREARAVIRRAREGNVARCLDKTLIALGKATGTDLLV